MSTQLDREQVNQLIAQKRYDEAKNVLRQSVDPSAKVWLDRLEAQFPSESATADDDEEELPSDYADSYRKERGGCFTIWLLLSLVANSLAVLYYIGNGSNIASQLNIPSWIIILIIVFGITNVISAVGIMQWKVWGAYGFFGSGICVFFLDLAAIGLNVATIGGVIGLAIMGWFVNGHWDMFD